MKVALVIGASRGMGRQVAIKLAEQDYVVGVAAKTVVSSEKLPGTIYDVCDDIASMGKTATPIQVLPLLVFLEENFPITVIYI